MILSTFYRFLHIPLIIRGLSFVVRINEIIIIGKVDILNSFVDLTGLDLFLMIKIGIFLSELKVNQEIGVLIIVFRSVFGFVGRS